MFLYTKISKNSSVKYYKKYEEACEIYQDLSEEEKEKVGIWPRKSRHMTLRRWETKASCV